jgi:hypothetical protein
MVETKTVSQEKEELEKKLADLKAREEFEAFKLQQLKKKAAEAKPRTLKDPAKKQPEKEKPKERPTQEIFRVLKQDHNWKFVAGAIFAWFILWIFNH